MLTIRDKSVIHKPDFWIVCIVLSITGLLVSPILGWIANLTLSKEQIQHPFIVLCFAAYLIIQHHRLKLSLDLKTSNLLIGLLTACYLLVLAAYALQLVLLSILPLVTYLAALILFLFGKRHFEATLPLLIAFTAFLLIALYIPYADWPLRTYAGKAASAALAVFGLSTQLAIQVESQEVRLLMRVGEQIFHVAPECNGYGILSSNLLLSVIASLALRNPAYQLFIAVPAALAIAFAVNTLRIMVITQLAPYFVDNYMLMHEVAGISSLILGLYATWRVCLTLGRRRQPNAD
ncbi:MAG: archaeosortase/exosortase family protein [Verrucomicrobiota bacterium]